MGRVVEDGVGGDGLAAVVVEGFACVGVDVEAGEVAAGDVDTDAVALLEDVGTGVELDRHLVGRAGLHELLFLERVAEAGADDAVTDVHVEAAGEVGAGRVDVEELGGEVGIDSRGRCPELDDDLAGDFDVFLDWFGLEDGDVLWQLGNILRDEKGPSQKEIALSVEFFQDVWPRQKTVKTPEMTVTLCEVLMRSGERFSDLAEVVLPHLTGLSHHGNSLHFTDEVDSAISSAPKLFLEMLYSVLPNDVTGWPYGIGEVLAKLATADSDLGTEQHFVELKRIWDAR